MNYRERWYAERGLPYEPPKLESCPPFQCIGGAEKTVMPGRSKPAPRMREPGEDDEDIAA